MRQLDGPNIQWLLIRQINKMLFPSTEVNREDNKILFYFYILLPLEFEWKILLLTSKNASVNTEWVQPIDI